MTTLAALALGSHVVMGADSCTNVYERPLPGAARKIRRMRTVDGAEFLLGFCGAGGLADVLGQRLTAESLPGSAEGVQAWAARLSWACNDLAREVGLVQDGQMDGTLLLGVCGRLWSLANYQAIPHLDGIAALGSGEGPAIGALDALVGQVSPRDAVLRAVTIGCERDRYSQPPIQIEELAHG